MADGAGGGGGGSGPLDRAEGTRLVKSSCTGMAMLKTWRWNVGLAMAPLRYRMHAELELPSVIPRIYLEAANRSVPKAYGRLHVHREDDRYCDVLPCGTAGVVFAQTKNVSRCHAAAECFAGDGGRYVFDPGRGS